jgi:hypothetical protein
MNGNVPLDHTFLKQFYRSAAWPTDAHSEIASGERVSLQFTDLVNISKFLNSYNHNRVAWERDTFFEADWWVTRQEASSQNQIDFGVGWSSAAVLPSVQVKVAVSANLNSVDYSQPTRGFISRFYSAGDDLDVSHDQSSTVPVHNPQDEDVLFLQMGHYVEARLLIANDKASLAPCLTPLTHQERKASRRPEKCCPAAEGGQPISQTAAIVDRAERGQSIGGKQNNAEQGNIDARSKGENCLSEFFPAPHASDLAHRPRPWEHEPIGEAR